VYTDVTEFQFDLFCHISSAIHKALKSKEIGKSEEAIPQESAISLKNYNELLAQDPLINAISMLDKATDHLECYSKIQSDFTADIIKLSKVLVKEHRNIERAVQNIKPQKVQKSLDIIYNEMSSYSKKIAIKIPKLSIEFSNSIMSCLRAIKMLKDNNLEDKMPLTGISYNMGETRTALKSLIGAIKTIEPAFMDGSDDILDIKIQKQIVIALHQDLVSSLNKSIELLDRLMNELPDNV